jgi:hypothetical protein
MAVALSSDLQRWPLACHKFVAGVIKAGSKWTAGVNDTGENPDLELKTV